jgi:iron complex transport system substrate-binding protein
MSRYAWGIACGVMSIVSSTTAVMQTRFVDDARRRANPAWQSVEAVAAGRVYQYPGLPYSWGPRPPSVNRLPGLMWLAYVVSGRTFDAEFDADVRGYFKEFYHLELTDQQLRKLVAR